MPTEDTHQVVHNPFVAKVDEKGPQPFSIGSNLQGWDAAQDLKVYRVNIGIKNHDHPAHLWLHQRKDHLLAANPEKVRKIQET